MLAGFYASIFLIVCCAVDAVPQWKCKKYDIGNVDKKESVFINYMDCPKEYCLLNVTMLNMVSSHIVRNHPANQFVLFVNESVEIPVFKRKNRIGPNLLVKHFGNTDGLHVDKKLFGSSAVLIFDRLSALVYKLPYSFEFQRKKNMSRVLSQKNYSFILKASLFASIYENVCRNDLQQYSTEADYDYKSEEIYDRVQESTESTIISSKSQLSEKTIQSIYDMQKADSGEEFREILRKQKEDQLKIEQTEEDSNFNIPIRVIIPVEHIDLQNEIHKDDEKYLKYNYLVLKENHPEYHGHLDNDIPDTLVKGGLSEEIYKTEDGFLKYEVSSDYKTSSKFLEVKPVSDYESFTPAPAQDDEYDSTEKEMDVLVTLFHYIPWW